MEISPPQTPGQADVIGRPNGTSLAGTALAWRLGDIAVAAGAAIMAIYATGTVAEAKADGSPLTEADLAADAIIAARLAAELPDIPVVSEESAPPAEAGDLPRFLLVDPLDGTKEFIARNGEFTVNIALVEHGTPVCGAVYAPALGRLWVGAAGEGGFVAEIAPGADLATATQRPIRVRAKPQQLTAVASRSHADQRTEAFLATLPIAARRSVGSSLKFCLLAEGEADVYPRFAPTMEWDTAAGHAVLLAAGGSVTDTEGGPFAYGKKGAAWRNGYFIAWGER